MGERDLSTKRGRQAFREFCERYCDKLGLFEVELRLLAMRAGGMLAALDELEHARIKGIREAARLFDEEVELPRRKV